MKNFHQDLLDKFHNIKEKKRNSALEEFFSLDTKKWNQHRNYIKHNLMTLLHFGEDKELQNVAKCARKWLIVPEPNLVASYSSAIVQITR